MSFVGDPLTVIQPAIVSFLSDMFSAADVAIEAEIAENVGWRPHILERDTARAWHIHASLPETNSWSDRIERAMAASPNLRAGVVAPQDVLLDDEFIRECNRINASIISISNVSGFADINPKFYWSAAEFVIETGAQLSQECAASILQSNLSRALADQNSHKRGILFEIVVALLLSQVRGFEVQDIGISNRTQQMDVLAHNRNTGGSLSGSPIVLAEAKNWKDPVDIREYAAFLRKMQSRHGRAKLGFLVTSGRFTEGVTLERRRESESDYLVVLVDGETLRSVWETGQSITERIERLTVQAAIGT